MPRTRRINGSRMLPFSTMISLVFFYVVAKLPNVFADISMPYTSTPDTSPTDTDFYYQVTVESYAARLQYLASFDLGEDGTFKLAMSLLLSIAVPKADAGRSMLYLLACDEDSTAAFLGLPSSENGLSKVHIPPYCAMPNRTLDYYCQSFPLEDESEDEFVYQSTKIVTGSATDVPLTKHSHVGPEVGSGSTKSTGATTIFFFIDSCETLGGQQGILRSCLEKPPGSKQPEINQEKEDDDPPCFYCPKNYPASYSNKIEAIAESEGCTTSSPLPPTLRGVVAMNLCNSQGGCLGKMTNLQSIFYGLSSLIWGLTSFVWIVHIHAAARDAVVELQHKLKLIPLSQVCYSVLTFADLYTEDKLVGTARSLVQNIAVLSQLVALAVFAEVVVLIAKGWKITRPALLPRELQWIRFVTLSWAASFAVLKHTDSKQLAVVIVWGLSWACVVFMVWYNSAFNLNMLKYQLAMVRQLDIDPQLTPVYTKFMLFRRFRGLLAGYIFLTCFFGIAGLVNDATQQSSEWTTLVTDEGLTLILFIALGYTFRCRRFSRLIRTNGNRPSLAEGNIPTLINQGVLPRGSILPEPAPLEPVEPPKRKKTIVVLNPDHAPWLATSLDSIEQTGKPATVPKSSITS